MPSQMMMMMVMNYAKLDDDDDDELCQVRSSFRDTYGLVACVLNWCERLLKV